MVRVITLLLVLSSVIVVTQALPKLEYETTSSYSRSDLNSEYNDLKDASANSREVTHTEGKSGPGGSTTISKVSNYDDGKATCVVKVKKSEGDGPQRKHEEGCNPEEVKEPFKDSEKN
ncbi:hypothetical protein K7432_004626 [Basidiobolus ranarum]|uniref:Secreted protein n=1 Tax=Basidiobolus ranarum TaxID=34480 RepID=A0ABR2WY04_9FUNG